jgi:hypothetical protein
LALFFFFAARMSDSTSNAVVQDYGFHNPTFTGLGDTHALLPGSGILWSNAVLLVD